MWFWNLTLAANIISANVQYGQIEDIKAVSGVRDVVLEALYEPCEVDEGEEYEPNMSTSPEQIGSPAAYAAGYTGAGTRIAIVDTGLGPDHISFPQQAFSIPAHAGRPGGCALRTSSSLICWMRRKFRRIWIS